MEELDELAREYGLDEDCMRIWFGNDQIRNPEKANERIRGCIDQMRSGEGWNEVFAELKQIQQLGHDSLLILLNLTELLGGLAYDIDDPVIAFVLLIVTQIINEITKRQTVT